jgi:hypothetical protein
VADELYPLPRRRSPFKDYVRMLTPEGGILILYKDQDRGWFSDGPASSPGSWRPASEAG